MKKKFFGWLLVGLIAFVGVYQIGINLAKPAYAAIPVPCPNPDYSCRHDMDPCSSGMCTCKGYGNPVIVCYMLIN